MKKKLIFATGNEGKMKEIREILGDLDYELLSMKEAGVDIDIVEDGTTFEENALIKAKAVAAQCNDIVLADDSGLEVDFVIRYKGACTLVEVKAATGNIKSTKTILNHPEKYHVSSAIKLGDYNVGRMGQVLTLPLYMAFLLRTL